LFYHKQKQFVVGHFLHRLRRRAVDLTAYPVIFGVGVNPQFDDFVGGAGFRWIRGCHGFLGSRILVPLNNLMSSSSQPDSGGAFLQKHMGWNSQTPVTRANHP
jgi:hypothetical protein